MGNSTSRPTVPPPTQADGRPRPRSMSSTSTMDVDPPASQSPALPTLPRAHRTRFPTSSSAASAISTASTQTTASTSASSRLAATLRSRATTVRERGPAPAPPAEGEETAGSVGRKRRRRMSDLLGLGRSRRPRHDELSETAAHSQGPSSSSTPLEPGPSMYRQTPPSATASPSSLNTDIALAPSDPPTPAATVDDVDPLRSPRSRAYSLISQMSLEEPTSASIPTAAFINPSSSVPEPAALPAVPPSPQRSLPPPPPPSHTERRGLGERLFSGLLAATGGEGAGMATAAQTEPVRAHRQPPVPASRGIPSGTSLIVQGLVQTTNPRTATLPTGTARSSPRSGRTLSRSLGGATDIRSPVVGDESPEEDDGNLSHEAQAFMLGDLLAVATAATASSLLSPPGPSAPATVAHQAVTSASPLASIRERLARRTSRPAAVSPLEDDAPARGSAEAGIEEVLRSYMASALARRAGGSSNASASGARQPDENLPVLQQHLNEGAGGEDEEDEAEPEPGSFQAFLTDLRVDLVRALREHNGLAPEEEATPTDETESEQPVVAAPDSPEAVESVLLPPEDQEMTEASTAATPAATSSRPAAGPTSAGPSSSADAASPAEPRRLNWMRIYRFPPRDAAGTLAAPNHQSSSEEDPAASGPSSATASQADSAVQGFDRPSSSSAAASSSMSRSGTDAAPPLSQQVTPMIMVGVRSVTVMPRPSPAAGLGNSANRRSSNGSSSFPVPDPQQPDRGGDLDIADPSSTADLLSDRVRRVLQNIRNRRNNAPPTTMNATADDDETDDDTGAGGLSANGTSSFVLWVVGGLYRADHPILAAPGLFTGELDHEDLWALAALLGQAKPPTATSEEIKQSSLPTFAGSELKAALGRGEVLANSADRCVICLGDYEDDEKLRLLGCKHVYHLECIDRWLEVGRNACPACRAKGVEVSADREAAAETAPVPTPQA